MAGGGRKAICGSVSHAPCTGTIEDAHDKILEESIAAFEEEIRATGEMGGLLEEDGIGAKNLAGIYGDFLREL
jgi:hypothetical protein